MIAKLCHDSFHSAFVFFKEKTELLVFVQQGLVFYDNLGICALEFGLEDLCLYIKAEECI